MRIMEALACRVANNRSSRDLHWSKELVFSISVTEGKRPVQRLVALCDRLVSCTQNGGLRSIILIPEITTPVEPFYDL
jgi:hypothetical protein